LNTGVADKYRAFPPTGPVTPPRQMVVYMVQLDQDRSAEQARTLVLMPILMPQIKIQVVIKANRGQGESLREQDTTADDDWERGVSEGSELRKAPAAHPNKVLKVKGKTPKTG